jgi:hypothetical protein
MYQSTISRVETGTREGTVCRPRNEATRCTMMLSCVAFDVREAVFVVCRGCTSSTR